MYCYKCGSQIEDNAKFCPICGTKQESLAQVSGNQSKVHTADKTENFTGSKVNSKPAQKKRWPAIVIAVVAVICVAVAVVICIHIFRSDKEDERGSVDHMANHSESSDADDNTEPEEDIGGSLNSTEGTEKEPEIEAPPAERPDEAPSSSDDEKPQNVEEPAEETLSPIRSQVSAELSQLESDAAVIEQKLNDAQTQSDMNRYSGELYTLWDNYIIVLWGYLRENLPEAEFSALTDEQLDWIVAKEAAIEEAASDVKGGTMEPLVRNTVATEWTIERIYELVEYLP